MDLVLPVPAGLAGDRGSDTVAACFHCGDALPATPASRRVDGQARAFCCEGCAAAAQWIDEAQLDDYYRLRSAPAQRVATEAADLAAWDRDDVQSQHAHDVPGGREMVLLTDGMRCAACAWLIDRALAREPGVLEVAANAVTGRVRIAWDPRQTRLSLALRRLSALGYRPYLATGQAREQARRRARNRDLLRIGLAGLAAMQAMMLAEALYLDTAGAMPLATRDFFRWVTFLVSTPVVFWAGWPFLAGAWRELRQRQPGMDTLVATSTLLAYGASVLGTVRGSAHVWYDAAVMFVFLLLAARLLEQRARDVATAQVDALARARPALATRERSGGGREVVPISALAAGDVAWVAAGETVPADGTLLDAAAAFEEALLTGESRPVEKAPGARVLAGTVCRERPARFRVDEVGSATRLSQVERLVAHAQGQRPAVARIADRVATRFVSMLMLAAVVVYLGWRIHDPARAFEVTLALLVISCPCALSLSIPAALAAAHGSLARMGVLALKPDSLALLARATDIVFDKTGTLGDGRMELATVDVQAGFTRGTVVAIAAALERDSRHPIAAAFTGLGDTRSAEAIAEHPGHGVQGLVGGRPWRLGEAGFAAGLPDDGALWLGDGSRPAARFVLREAARPDARPAIAALRAQGLAVHLSSGDGDAAVAAFGAGLGIASTAARQSPEAKLAAVREMQGRGRVVAMVGDGLNDAPVLAGADVSLAIAEGAALAHRAADLVLTGASLARIPAAIDLARRTQRVIRQNLAWATAYNVLALPLAALGLVTPWLAALGMAASSLVVTLNALRLAWRPTP